MEGRITFTMIKIYLSFTKRSLCVALNTRVPHACQIHEVLPHNSIRNKVVLNNARRGLSKGRNTGSQLMVSLRELRELPCSGRQSEVTAQKAEAALGSQLWCWRLGHSQSPVTLAGKCFKCKHTHSAVDSLPPPSYRHQANKAFIFLSSPPCPLC